MKLWHKGLNRCTIYFGMGFHNAMRRGLWNQLLKWELLRKHLIWPNLFKRKIFSKEKLFKGKIFLKEKSSQMNTFLEWKIFLNRKSSYKKNSFERKNLHHKKWLSTYEGLLPPTCCFLRTLIARGNIRPKCASLEKLLAQSSSTWFLKI